MSDPQQQDGDASGTVSEFHEVVNALVVRGADPALIERLRSGVGRTLAFLARKDDEHAKLVRIARGLAVARTHDGRTGYCVHCSDYPGHDPRCIVVLSREITGLREGDTP